MDRDALKATFDQQAASYDHKWSRLAALRDALHLLVGSVFGPLPADARLLCVGAGTGAEIAWLAARFPGWSFTAVEPAPGMLAMCRRRAEAEGFAARCTFHEGYVDTLPASGAAGAFDAATSLLVSQFILDPQARTEFFRGIAARLRPGGLLVSTDLSGDVSSAAYASLLEVWLRTIASADASPEAREQMLAAYRRDVAVLPPQRVEALLVAAGFEPPVQFYQAGLIHGWFARRAAAASGAEPAH